MQVLLLFFFLIMFFLLSQSGRGRGIYRKKKLYIQGEQGSPGRRRGPVEGTRVIPALALSKPRERSGDISPFKKMLFPSCDPALAWESVLDRPRLSLPAV